MHVSKWGKSLAVRLPKALVEAMDLAEGDEIEIVQAAGKRIALRKSGRCDEALARMAARDWRSPADYKFNRDEANER